MEPTNISNPNPPAIAQIQPISMSIKDAAAACGLSRSGIYKAINEGRLKSVMVGARRLVRLRDLQAFIDGGAA